MTVPESQHGVIAANADAYSRIARKWSGMWNEENERYHMPCRRLFLDRLNGSRILDAGCGPGRDSLYFAGRGMSVTACDTVAAFLPGIRSAEPSIETAVMDMTRPCFSGETFDGIYLFASFLHIPHELSLKTLAGFYAMLRPGGLLFMHHVRSEKGYRSYRVDNLLIDDNPAFCFCHDESELTVLAVDAGFRHCSISHLDPLRKPSAVREHYGLAAYQFIAEKNG